MVSDHELVNKLKKEKFPIICIGTCDETVQRDRAMGVSCVTLIHVEPQCELT